MNEALTVFSALETLHNQERERKARNRQAAEAVRLLERAALAPARMAFLIQSSGQRADDKIARVKQLLPHIAAFIDDGDAPDPSWWRDYFLLIGAHVILTEEGWEPGECKASYLADNPAWEPLDELNALAQPLTEDTHAKAKPE